MDQNNNSQPVSVDESEQVHHVYEYPTWIYSAHMVKRISNNNGNPIWVSILRTHGRYLLDIRRFYQGQPSPLGVFLTRAAAEELINVLDDYLSGKLTDPYDEYVPEWQ